MGESLRGGLSLTSSGFGFWSHDIGGFEDTSTPDVYKRWAAFGLLSTHSRLHGSSSYRVPWNYGEEAVDVLRFFTRLKMSLMPYIYAGAVNTSRTGVPLMRSMVMEFTKDYNCHYLERQYMFGDNILVAPIFNEEGIGRFYLPEGTWTDYFTGETYPGGRWYEKTYDYMSIPMFVRENSIIAKGSRDDCPDYDYADHAEFRVYELTGQAEAVIYSHNEQQAKITAQRLGEGGAEFDVTSDKPWSIRLVNCHVQSVQGAQAVTDGPDTILTPQNGAAQITVKF